MSRQRLGILCSIWRAAAVTFLLFSAPPLNQPLRAFAPSRDQKAALSYTLTMR